MSDKWEFDKKLGCRIPKTPEEEQIKIPVIWEFNGEVVGTAKNIRIDKTGALVCADLDLDLDPDTMEPIDLMQQSPTMETSIEGNIHAEPVTLKSLAETLKEMEMSRPNMTMKKAEFFAHPEQAPEWLADEFEIVDIYVSERAKKGKMVIMDSEAAGRPMIMAPGNIEPLWRTKAKRVIIFIHPEDMKK